MLTNLCVEKFKEENWDLEMHLQELQGKLSKSQDAYTKMTSETGKLQDDKNTHIDTIESLKLREDELKKELASLKSRHENTVTELKNQHEDLKAENTSLSQSLADLNTELETTKLNLPPPIEPDDQEVIDLSQDEGDFGTPDNSPPTSPIKATPSRNANLESDTVKRSLGHAHKLITGLKSTVHKERTEKSELKRLLSDTQEELEAVRSGTTNQSGGLKNKRSRVFQRGAVGGGVAAGAAVGATAGMLGQSVRRVKSRVYDESTPGKNEGWEEETDSTNTESEDYQSAFETGLDDPTDDQYVTGQETMDEDSGGDTETEEVSPPTTGYRSFQNQSIDDGDSSTSDEDASNNTPSHSNSMRSRRNSRYRRSVVSSSSKYSPQTTGSQQPPPIPHSPTEETTPVKQKSLASEFMSVDDIERHASDHGLVVVPSEEYENMVNKSELTKEDIETHASELNLEVVSKSYLDDLNSTIESYKSKGYITKAAEGFGLAVVGKEIYSKLIHPEEHSKLKSDYDSISQQHNSVKEAHDNLTRDHSDVAAKYEQLMQDHSSLQTNHGDLTKEVESLKTEQERLNKEVSRDLTPEELGSKATNVGYVAVASKEYFDLVRAANSPSIEEISDKAKGLGYVIAPKAEYQSLEELAHNPTADDLHDKAGPLGLTVLSVTEYKDLKRQLEHPSSEELTSKAQSLGYTLVGSSDYQQTVKNAEEPDLTHLKSKAQVLNYQIISDSDLNELQKIVDTPDEDHIKSKAEGLGLTTLPKDQYEQLSKHANEPDESHIKSKALGVGLVALGAAEHKNLLRSVENPTREEIETKAKDLGLVTMDHESHNELTRLANNPEVDELTERAASIGYTAVPKEEFDSITKSANEPSVEELKAKAEKAGLVAIGSDEYERLTNPTAEQVEGFAKSQGLIAVPVAKYRSIEEAANTPITKDYVESAAASLGLTALTAGALSKLKSPDSDEVKKHSERHGFSMVPHDELKSLRNPPDPTEAEVTKSAKKHGMVTVPKEKYDELVKPYSPTQSELENSARGFGLVTVPESVYAKLTAEPTKDELTEKIKGFGMVPLPKEQHEELSSRPKEYKPTREELETHAKSNKLALLSHDDYEDLNKKATNPSRQHLEQAASNAGFSLLANNELEELKRKSNNPTKTELDFVAAQAGFAVVTVAGLSDLTKRAEEPSRDIVMSTAGKHGLVAVDNDEYDSYRRKVDEPTEEELKTAGASLGFELVPKTEYSEIKRKATSPTKEDLETAGETLDMVVVPKAEYEQLEEPSVEMLQRYARRAGMAMVTVNDLEDLRRKSTQPSKTDLEGFANKLGLVVLSKEEYSSLNEKQSTHDRSDSPISLTSSVAAKRDHFEGIIKQSKGTSSAHGDKIVESMKSLGYVPVSSDEYKRLIENQTAFEPTKRDILRHAKGFGLAAIPIEEYKSLKMGHFKTASISSDGDDLNKVSTPSPTRSRQLGGSVEGTPTKQEFSDLDLTSVPAEYLTSLRRIVESPTRDDIISLSQKAGLNYNDYTADALNSRAQELGMVAVTEDEYKDLETKARRSMGPTSVEGLMDSAGELGMVAITAEEYEELSEKADAADNREVNISNEDLEKHAAVLGYVALPQDKYYSMQQQQQDRSLTSSSPSNEITHDELEQRAQQLGLVTLPENVYNELSSRKPASGVLDVDDLRDEARKAGYELVEPGRRPSAATSESSMFVDERARSGVNAVPVGERVSEEEAVERARNLGYVVAKDKRDLANVAKGLGLIVLTDMSADDVKAHAQKLGYVALPETKYKYLVEKKESAATPSSPEELRAQAYNLGFVMLKEDKYKSLMASENQRNTPRQLSIDEIEAQAQRLGYMAMPEDRYRNLMSGRESQMSTSTSNSYYDAPNENTNANNNEATLKEVRGSPITVVNKNQVNRHEVQSAVLEDTSSERSADTDEITRPPTSLAHTPLPSVVEDGVVKGLSNVHDPSSNGGVGANGRQLYDAPKLNSRQATQSSSGTATNGNSPGINHQDGIPTAASSATIATSNTSLGERNMIPYITQVVIGEYLFKYTRRSGLAVSGISGNRHERFFWIHPYTMTLYWSKDNPALENKHSKTKSAAIVSVKQVEDENPLPPGLHHRSIEIETPERRIRLTCPTRQRHSIWYNSLVFLLKRSADELNFDDDEEEGDDYDYYNDDNRFERERAKTASTPRNSKQKVLSFRRSMAPEMNTTRASRQTSVGSLQRTSQNGQYNNNISNNIRASSSQAESSRQRQSSGGSGGRKS